MEVWKSPTKYATELQISWILMIIHVAMPRSGRLVLNSHKSFLYQLIYFGGVNKHHHAPIFPSLASTSGLGGRVSYPFKQNPLY